VIVAPTVNYGVARAAIGFPGTLSLDPETLRRWSWKSAARWYATT
jgi:creatinine amidohydrolase/Fe(II)-dependent formamide hydrolase-like protein